MDRRRSYSVRGLDRFIPHRPSLDVNVSHARLLSSSSVCSDDVPKQYRNMSTRRYQRLISDALHVTDGKILPMTSTPTKQPGPFTNRQNILSPSSPDEGYSSPTTESRRRIHTSAECIMDMPGLRDDFYTNLLDWNSQNLLAVALSHSIYVWNAATKECQRVEIHFPGSEQIPENLYVSALSWSPYDQHLAVADSFGDITVCDIEKKIHVHPMFGQLHSQTCSVGALQWTDYGLISGNRKGAISIMDMRTPRRTMAEVRQLKERGMEVCGLKLCPGTPYLASGEDNGRVSIWDLRMVKLYTIINAHTACAKAIAWCPWRSSILATGGGSSDGHIRIWHIHTGDMRAEVDAKSQICSLLWPGEYGELVSSHSSTTPENNDIFLWGMRRSYQFEPVARLRQHMGRPLHLALSPDHTTIASAGADEALCLWKSFPRKSSSKSPLNMSPLNMFHYIR